MRNKKETASKVKRQQLIDAQLLYAQYHFKRSQIKSDTSWSFFWFIKMILRIKVLTVRMLLLKKMSKQ